MNEQDQNETAPIPHTPNLENIFGVLQNARNEIASLRRRLELAEARIEVMNIFAAALQGRNSFGGEALMHDPLFAIGVEIERIGALLEKQKRDSECFHRSVTVTEDGGRCDDCKQDVAYNEASRNWVLSKDYEQPSCPNPSNPANL